MMSISETTYTLSPSDFGFTWDECRHCYYLQVVRRIRRPRGPFPSIFSNIDSAIKRRFAADEWHSFGGTGQPRFKIAYREKMINSETIALPGRQVAVSLKGRYDSVLRFEDETLALCDFKTSAVRAEYLDKYWVQLHAYTFALEHPAPGSLSLPKIDRLGLAVFEPNDFSYESDVGGSLNGPLQWIDL